MANTKKRKDNNMSGQISLFDMVRERQEKRSQKSTRAGVFNIKNELQEMLSEGLKQYKGSRYDAAAKMSELVGQEITKTMLDSWTAESKTNHRFPAEYLPAFCQVTGYKEPLEKMANLIDCYLLESEDALLAELGKIEKAKKELSEKEAAIKNFLEKMR
ncbi:MAG: hypothetical protein PWR10_1571 [Halanaerobiales bacterium]|nr:hypothetical protein [Halanaerobiales bacterium]